MKNGTSMINPLERFFEKQKLIVIDGALATELEARGADLRDPLWSAKLLLEAPEQIQRVHYDYFVAGADVAITASYQASFPGFAKRGIGAEEAAALMRKSVQLAHNARCQFWHALPDSEKEERVRPLVAASIGPYGAWLADGSEYRGDYGVSRQGLMDFHRPRLRVLAETVRSGEADLLACETIPSLAEGEALLQLLGEIPDIPAWLSFSCCDGEHVCHGERFADCVSMVSSLEQVVAVGLNCTPPQHVEALLRSALPVTDKPLLAYPNSGELWQSETNTWASTLLSGDFCQWTNAWFDAGARLLGGCCRTGPVDVERIRHTMQQHSSPRQHQREASSEQ